jgi:hypothetical protein
MAGVLVAGTIMLGCGIEGQPFGSDSEGDSDPVISTDDVSAEEEGSPEYTTLQWWRGMQTRNPEAVKPAYAPDVRDELPEGFDTAVISFLAPAASQSSIEIDSVEFDGKKDAVLFATIDSPNFAMDGPLALPMKKVGDEWLIANSTYITSLAGSFQVAQALGDGASEPSGQTTTEETTTTEGG